MTDLLAVPGASSTTPEFRAAFAEMVERNGWNGDAIAAVISHESGFKARAMNPQPGQTATGLIQFTIGTLRGLGWNGTREQFAALDELEQLPFVERYFRRAFPGGPPSRPVDYYLATWGARAGLPLSHVLASKAGSEADPTGRLYTLNAGLDRNGDGFIRVEDLDVALAAVMAKAGGRRLPVGKGEQGAPASSSPGPSSESLGLVFLPVLRPAARGVFSSRGPAVDLWRSLLELAGHRVVRLLHGFEPEVFDEGLAKATRDFQRARALTVDGVVGHRETWPAMIRLLRSARGL
jgi:peptidoglycan hydrolase-like protein with peptidoglycan-binding domain